MLGVYKSFHQTVKYGWQRNHILQDSTGLEIKISMTVSKTENRVQTGFQQQKTSLLNKPVLTSLLSNHTYCCSRHLSYSVYCIIVLVMIC